MLWSEKYRPKFKIEAPHHNLLLHGPPGTGKTTYALQLSPDIELNASSHRGIETIRNLPTNKYIFLDECDYLTSDAQNCLRRIMEKGKFILCANYLSKLSLPIRSRAQIIKFNKDRMKEHLIQIIKVEKLSIDPDLLWKECDMDIRRCLNVLQSYKALSLLSTDDTTPVSNIDLKDIKSYDNKASVENNNLDDISLSDEEIVSFKGANEKDNHCDNSSLLNYLLGHIAEETIHEFLNIKNVEIQQFTKKFINSAQLVTKLILSLSDLIVSEPDHNDPFFPFVHLRPSLSMILSQAEEFVTQGVDSELVLYWMASGWCRAKNKITN